MVVLCPRMIKLFGKFFSLAIGFVYTTSVELSTTHLSEKESKFYQLLKSGYMQNKICCKTFATPDIEDFILRLRE
jgi:hypothetical protein